MKNDNLNITFSIGRYMITILKFTYECQTWNTPSHSHSSNSYELHYIPQGRGTLISSQKSYDLYPNVLYTTGPHVEHQQYPDPVVDTETETTDSHSFFAETEDEAD